MPSTFSTAVTETVRQSAPELALCGRRVDMVAIYQKGRESIASSALSGWERGKGDKLSYTIGP